MPIKVSCACGKISTVADQHAGKKGRCGACGATNMIPSPAPGSASGGIDLDDDGDEGDEFVEPGQLPPRAAPTTSSSSTPQAAPAPPPSTSPAPPDPEEPAPEIRCRCGKKFRYDVKDAGKRARCPSCRATLDVPRWVYMPTVQRVHLIDAELPFGSMCWLIFKWTLASIPTAIVVWMVIFVIQAIGSGK